MVTFAHLSDLHLPPLPPVRPWQLAGKRVLGYWSWQRKRKHEHRAEVLRALSRDLREQAPDRLCVTGDLTNLGLPEEFARASDWLASLGPAERVSLVPGNHDAYTRAATARIAAAWAPWLTGDDGRAGFPWLRLHGGVAFVGVSTAVPTAPFRATGRVGAAQLRRLRQRLRDAAGQAAIRVLLLHHPPQAGAVPRRRALSDASRLRGVLAEAGCELVLHGHAHVPLQTTLPGPDGPIPVLGASSASLLRDGHGQTGSYAIVELRDDGTAHLRRRVYDPARESFQPGPDGTITLPGPAGGFATRRHGVI